MSNNNRIEIAEKLIATVYINGEKKEATVQNGENAGALAIRLAQTYGIRSFELLVDNTKLSPEKANTTPMTSNTQVAINAKDSRGKDDFSTDPMPAMPSAHDPSSVDGEGILADAGDGLEGDAPEREKVPA